MSCTNPDDAAAAVVYVSNIRALAKATGFELDQLSDRTQRTLEVMLANHSNLGPALVELVHAARDVEARSCTALGGEM